MSETRKLYLAVAACAIVVHLGALWNQFALDDRLIVVFNPLVQSLSGAWESFAAPYWPANLGGLVYRPLPIASYAIDYQLHSAAWFHLVNLLWHAGVTVAVTALARRWTSPTAALAAGLLFAVHPVHVEVVASVVGRADLMATLGTCLAVYAAVAYDSIGWSAAFLAFGILSKESAAATPALIALAWLIGLAHPPRRRMAMYGASWLAIAVLYFVLRWTVLHPYEGFPNIAPQFIDQSPLTIRYTAVAELVDVVRLLVFPLHLQADYSPMERVAVTSPLAGAFLLGLLCLGVWAMLFALAWRSRRRVEAFGLGWIGLAYLPVANLLIPHGVVMAERLLYLPSVGLVLAVGAALDRLPRRSWAIATSALVIAAGVRSAVRVPVWRNNQAAALAMISDAPLSYRSWDYLGWEYLWVRRDERALESFRRAASIYREDARMPLAAAHMAYVLGRTALADSLLQRADSICPRCPTAYHNQASAARLRGDTAAARFLLDHVQRRLGP
jgi:tetratricopeptide (TPR) repeat protein